MTTLSIIGGRLIEPASQQDCIQDVHIADGRIVAFGAAPQGFASKRKIDASGRIVCPGLVDLAVRLREPGAEHKATIVSETRAAACNGITTLSCPPDTNPVIDTPAVAELLQQRSEASGMSHISPLAALTKGLQGEHLAEMADMKEAGCVGVSNGWQPVHNTRVLRNALDYAASCGMTLFVQAQEAWLGRGGCAHEGALSDRLGLPGIPESAETIEVARYLLLIEQTGVKAHFCRLSTARAVEMIRQARARGLPVTADVSAHQLFLTEMDIADYQAQCHVYPPLRSQRDRDALRQGVLDGTISAICSDHQPHEPDAKLAPFGDTEPGISALDSFLPLSLRLGHELGMALPELLSRLTWQPGQILGTERGRLQVGMLADICIFDPHLDWQLTPASMYCHRHNTPFLNWHMQGRTVCTLLSGRVAFEAAPLQAHA